MTIPVSKKHLTALAITDTEIAALRAEHKLNLAEARAAAVGLKLRRMATLGNPADAVAHLVEILFPRPEKKAKS